MHYILLTSTNPCITAYIVNAETLFTPSLSWIFLRWLITVVILILSFSAISLLIMPSQQIEHLLSSREVEVLSLVAQGMEGRF